MNSNINVLRGLSTPTPHRVYLDISGGEMAFSAVLFYNIASSLIALAYALLIFIYAPRIRKLE